MPLFTTRRCRRPPLAQRKCRCPPLSCLHCRRRHRSRRHHTCRHRSHRRSHCSSIFMIRLVDILLLRLFLNFNYLTNLLSVLAAPFFSYITSAPLCHTHHVIRGGTEVLRTANQKGATLYFYLSSCSDFFMHFSPYFSVISRLSNHRCEVRRECRG